MKKLFKKLFFLVVMLSTLNVGCSQKNNDEKQPEETYKLEALIGSIDEKVEVEVHEELISANQILAEEQYVIVYRPKNGIYEFPSFITPDQVEVDKCGNFLLSYIDEKTYLIDYKNLQDNKKTQFAVKLQKDDLIVDDITDENLENSNEENSESTEEENSSNKEDNIEE